jgi:diphthine-ammonia ligase
MGLKLLSLVSGGKDSLMSLMIAVAQGHEVIVLGHLTNAKAGEETDSYMYQSVGSNIVQEALADAIGLPIITKTITGTSLVTDADYHVNDQDEVEDLYWLLKNAKDEYGIEGITSGAILSTYQRVRVENVCSRLGLISLAYCWHVDQTVLLDLMIDVGLEAILVKVAAMGLNSEHLGLTLNEMKDTLSVLNRLYDVHVAGEGGEYETLTLDCPIFKKKILIKQSKTILHSNDAFAPVSYLQVLDWELIDKPDIELDLRHRMSFETIQKINSTLTKQENDLEYVFPSAILETEEHRYVFISGVSLETLAEANSIPIEDEVKMIMDDLRLKLEKNCLSFESVALVHVYVKNMNCFAKMNQIYSTYFGVNPPAR